LAQGLRESFADDGITVVEEHATTVAREAGPAGEVVVTTDSGEQVRGARVLVATGRLPRIDGLDLAAAGVDVDERGFIVVDEAQRTSNPRIYAAGDVSGAPQYVYVAAAGGRAAALNGLTEDEALIRGHACDCRVLDLSDVPRALVQHDTRGAVKLVADAESGEILGVHALADGAGEIMLAATYAIKAGMTVDDLADTWAP